MFINISLLSINLLFQNALFYLASTQ